MSYKLAFRKKALKEWKKLDGTTRSQFKKKLEERLEDPHVPASGLHSMPGCYKIKLHSVGYRLVYQVVDEALIVEVITVGRRDSKIYEKAAELISVKNKTTRKPDTFKREFKLTQVYRPLEVNGSGEVTKTESIHVLLVDHVIGDKIQLHAPFRRTLRDITVEAGYEGECGFVWFMDDDINGPWIFSVPDIPAWMDYFDNELQPEQFQNVIGTVTVDMDRLNNAIS
jgi:mRNA interferase RelE/StbE